MFPELKNKIMGKRVLNKEKEIFLFRRFELIRIFRFIRRFRVTRRFKVIRRFRLKRFRRFFLYMLQIFFKDIFVCDAKIFMCHYVCFLVLVVNEM